MVLTWEEIKMYGCDGIEYEPGNEKVFVRAFREMTPMGQKLTEEDLLTPENMGKIQEAADVSDEYFTMEQFIAAAKQLYLLGELKHKPAPAEVVKETMSPSQKAWSEFRIFTDSHSVADCKARARTDEAYAKFLHTNLVREMGNGSDVQDAVMGVGTAAVGQDKTIVITNDLHKFAEEYRHTSAADVRRLSSAALNPNGYKLYRAKWDECILAGLL
jgi:hypothetical protein